eukprot:TRINITY_DN15015_c0_g1_i1.p1 TRINITY_DN15015_c0_g1~~TRINITY_DN15015_c0_g1_i1.p1  ORF type:complete len:939 (+),score=307.06 TRINITY_DN15015_c0_g1_i1:89-2905(+)
MAQEPRQQGREPFWAHHGAHRKASQAPARSRQPGLCSPDSPVGNDLAADASESGGRLRRRSQARSRPQREEVPAAQGKGRGGKSGKGGHKGGKGATSRQLSGAPQQSTPEARPRIGGPRPAQTGPRRLVGLARLNAARRSEAVSENDDSGDIAKDEIPACQNKDHEVESTVPAAPNDEMIGILSNDDDAGDEKLEEAREAEKPEEERFEMSEDPEEAEELEQWAEMFGGEPSGRPQFGSAQLQVKDDDIDREGTGVLEAEMLDTMQGRQQHPGDTEESGMFLEVQEKDEQADDEREDAENEKLEKHDRPELEQEEPELAQVEFELEQEKQELAQADQELAHEEQELEFVEQELKQEEQGLAQEELRLKQQEERALEQEEQEQREEEREIDEQEEQEEQEQGEEEEEEQAAKHEEDEEEDEDEEADDAAAEDDREADEEEGKEEEEEEKEEEEEDEEDEEEDEEAESKRKNDGETHPRPRRLWIRKDRGVERLHQEDEKEEGFWDAASDKRCLETPSEGQDEEVAADDVEVETLEGDEKHTPRSDTVDVENLPKRPLQHETWLDAKVLVVRGAQGAVVRLAGEVGKAWLPQERIRPPVGRSESEICKALRKPVKVRIYAHGKDAGLPVATMWSNSDEANFQEATRRETEKAAKRRNTKSGRAPLKLREDYDPTKWLDGTVQNVQPYGIFVELPEGFQVLVPSRCIPQAESGTLPNFRVADQVQLRILSYLGREGLKGRDKFSCTMMPLSKEELDGEDTRTPGGSKGKGKRRGGQGRGNSHEAPTTSYSVWTTDKILESEGTLARQEAFEVNMLRAEELEKEYGHTDRRAFLARRGFAVVDYATSVQLSEVVKAKSEVKGDAVVPTKAVQVWLHFQSKGKLIGRIQVQGTATDYEKERLAVDLAMEEANDAIQAGANIQRVDVTDRGVLIRLKTDGGLKF